MSDRFAAISISAPTLSTRTAIWQLAHETDNSNACLLWCTDCFDHSLIAWINGELAGFVVAGEPRSGSAIARVLDVAVSAKFSRNLVVPPLPDHLITRLLARGITYVECTLTPAADSDLYRDLRALADRWHSQLSFTPSTGGAAPDTMTCTVGPFRTSTPNDRG